MKSSGQASSFRLLIQSALGLTTTEAENAFALSVVETGGIDHRIVSREKARTLKRNGLVEIVAASTTLDDIRGLGLLKEWLIRRGGAFGRAAKAYGLPAPKGLLIVGIPGTGKSLTTDFDTVVLSRACEQYTGAEIEAVFIDAMHEAFAEGHSASDRVRTALHGLSA